MRSGTESDARIAGLDGVRGLAILAVMAFHFSAIAAVPSTTAMDTVVARIAAGGWIGVDLFFVLSGFLITRILYQSAHSPEGYFRTFYARRALRIAPVYFLLLAILLILIPIVWSPASRDFRDLEYSQLWFWTYLTNVWVAIRSGANTDLYGTGHLWSLAIEEQFYLIWPAVVLTLRRRQLMAVCAGAIVGAFCFRVAMWAIDTPPPVTFVLTPSRVDALAVGGLIALCLDDPEDRALLGRCLWPAAAVATIALLIVVSMKWELNPFDRSVEYVGLSALAFLFGAFVAGEVVAPIAPVHRMLSSSILRAVGRYSYALYVFHWPIATWLSWNFEVSSWPPTVLGSHLPGKLLFVAVATALSLVAAWLSWQLFESRILALKSRFPYSAPMRAAASRGTEQSQIPAPPGG